MAKNSFTLFETLLSIVLLAIVIVGFSENSYYDNFNEEYQVLNSIENSFNLNSYDTNFINSSENLTIIKNDIEEDNLLVNKIEYLDKNISVVKYELK